MILASASPTRAAMLRNADIDFEIDPARIDEAAVKAAMQSEGAPPRDVADILAELKAERISTKYPGQLVLGADQILVLKTRIFEKPKSREEARDQLQDLRGERHQLLSAAVLMRDSIPIWRHIGSATLTMRPFTDTFLDSYLDRMGERVTDTVGGYQLEGLGGQLFSRVEGDYFSILGLPLLELLDILRRQDVLQE